MKIVFFGTGDFGIPALKKLLGSGHELALAVTRPDSVRGRGRRAWPTPVKAVLETSAPGTDILQPEKLDDKLFMERLEKAGADIFAVVDYGKILTRDILRMPRRYCVNLHPSLLPRYRGAAPINRAMLNGEKETGNTIISMNERMDAGDIISREALLINDKEDAVSLFGRLSRSGAELMIRTLEDISEGKERLIPQDESEATYAPKLEKSEGKIEWAEASSDIVRKLRAFQPWPGAYTYLGGRMVKVLKAEADDTDHGDVRPGTVISSGSQLVISAGKGSVRIVELQQEGRRAMTSAEFLRGHCIPDGTVL